MQRGTTPTAFVKDVLHLSSSKVTAWKNGSIPKNEILIKIADYFDVTVGYLFDGIEPQNPQKISPDEQRCLNAFNMLTHDDKIEFISRMEQRYEDYSPEIKEKVS